MNKKCFLLLIILLIPSLVLAKDISLSLDQKDYYFKTGEEAIINLNADNSYSETINGLMTYTITQTINQANFQYSSTNTNSKTFSLPKGQSNIGMDFGTSNSPATLSISLKFSYNKDSDREIILDGIKIHFVTDDSQKNNGQNKISSSSKKVQSQQQKDPLTKEDQHMKQLMAEMFGNHQQQAQNTGQKLQNNQLSQDSSALKKEMQKQIQEQQEMKKQFQQQLAQNPDFQKEHRDLLQQGYNLTNVALNPSSNNTGDFQLEYQNANNEKASLKGKMENGQIKNIQKDTALDRQKMLDLLKQNKKFQKFQEQLQKEEFQEKNTEFSNEINKTSIQIDYINQNNETALIKAEIMNNTVQKVEMEDLSKKQSKKYYWWIFPALLGIISSVLYKRINKKPQEYMVEEKIIEAPFDFKTKAIEMLNESEKLFKKKENKEAYGKAGQALRLFLNYKNNLNKETTNDEIINYLIEHKKAHKNAKECFDLCSLVRFAKYKANIKDFEKIIKIARKIIS